MLTAHAGSETPAVSVIVPARDEEVCLGACLQSLVTQAGVSVEIIVVDDDSTDRTRAIAASFAAVRVIDAGPVPPGWSGKTNAMASGAARARGPWLLFTDADTVHLPGSLARSLEEARRHDADLLSYSPQQEVHGFWEKAVMPVIFAELAVTYRPTQVSDPASSVAAANGQYLLISREAYEAVGGFGAVATNLLEDVAMARKVKVSGRRTVFRFGGDAVRARMYRSFAHLREGWTKNLALLFPSSVSLAGLRFAEFALITASAVLALGALLQAHTILAGVAGALFAVSYAAFIRRVRRAHFPPDATALAFLGLPIFSYLLLRSKISYSRGNIRWKGRTYSAHVGTAASPVPPSEARHSI